MSPKKPASRATARPAGQDVVQIAFTLPRFYLDALDREAALLGKKRGDVLRMLLDRKLGKYLRERSPSAPKVKPPKAAELEDGERYIWYLDQDEKRQFDALRNKMGGILPRAWIVLALNEWFGLPSGV